jgi:hypothetical protein
MKKYLYIIILLALVAAGLYLYFVAGNQLRAWRGGITGSDYAAKLYGDYSVIGQSCQGEDSNDDGYITCNFRLRSSVSAEEKTLILQCPTFWKSYMGTSCKENGFTINNQ